MTKQQVAEIFQSGESSTVEFKTEDVHPNSLAEEIVAFVNLEGGRISLGISDDGDIKKIILQNEIQKSIKNTDTDSLQRYYSVQEK